MGRLAVKGMGDDVLRGSRVRIRKPVLGDGDEVIEMNRRSKNLLHPWVYPPMDRSSWADYIRGLEGDRKEGFLVCLKETGAIAGVINISEIVRGFFQSAYLGYYSSDKYCGEGYVTEGLGLVVKGAFTTLKLHRLEANIQPNNHRSIALVRRLGFRKEGFSPRYLKIGGRWRDHERWAITVEEWRFTR